MDPKFETSPRRNKYELWVEILDLCTDKEIHLSQIMRDLRLRTGKCKEYLLFLLQKDLLSIKRDQSDQRIVYLTTSKGKKAVQQFMQVLSKYFH
ncbi:winged helix-turn-helix domain-containing protein [Candidatus Lokiarchaeum ossiferum]|uniref:winged helix-turn-helix domain-containing protein n=1 Tax=Candidatus Lokiarchaeum ossiferum TaxID=2951803 RepID=UPI00352ED259